MIEVLLFIYALSLFLIFCYSLIQLNLVVRYVQDKRRSRQSEDSESQMPSWPMVTVQLPIYNELYVVERLLEAITHLDYPKDRLEIQVLDDSTDETRTIVQDLVERYRADGFDIVQVLRENREGFKAGALAFGMEQAKGAFIAIFDSDFIPRSDFLKKTVPHFEDPKIGMVQTRWEHVNRNYSLLTELQAIGLDAHFTVEQKGRNIGGHFINFNGTAGVWRKTCIQEAGGWQADTLTEDLDLSYRAQLVGWKFHYKEECGAPAELPAHIGALKTQQYRWNKGAAECSRKNLGKVLASSKVNLGTKLHAIFHLLNSSVFICILVCALLSIPVLLITKTFPEYSRFYDMIGFIAVGFVFLSIFYYVSFARMFESKWQALLRFLYKFPLFLSVSMGLSLHNGVAAFEGLMGKKTPFVRTPKFNIKGKQDGWKGNKYLGGKVNLAAYLEVLLTLYFISGVVYAYTMGEYGFLPFHFMLSFGFGYVAFMSFKHAFQS